MSCSQSFCLKVIQDIVRTIKQDPSLTSFEIIPSASTQNRNASPVVNVESTLGIESWVIPHVLPYAHKEVLESNAKRHLDPTLLASLILTVNLLHPQMVTAWNRRRELILLEKLSTCDEMNITRLVLSNTPKSNEAWAHRRWLISNNLISGDNDRILTNELYLAEIIADRDQSSYHTWTHRQWCLRRLAPVMLEDSSSSDTTFVTEFTESDISSVLATTTLPIYLRELLTNLHFIHLNVSYYSVLHFRSFVIKQIFLIFQNTVLQIKSENINHSSYLDKEASSFNSRIKFRIIEFFNNCGDPGVVDYLNKLNQKLSLFDIQISLVLDELEIHGRESLFYINQEALWCYRRFLVFSFKSLLTEVEVNKSLPLTVVNAYLKTFMVSEQLLIAEGMEKSKVSGDPRIIKNYCNWLSKVAKLDFILSQPNENGK